MNLSLLAFSLLSSPLLARDHGDAPHKPVLTLDLAKQVAAAVVDEAKRNRATGVLAIVDDGGHPILVERIDGTFPAGAMVALGKAKTAALFKKPTKFFEDVIKNGRTAMVTIPDFTPLQGGVPLVLGGEIVGAIGVSGASSAQQDEDFALAGAKALGDGGPMAAAAPVKFFEKGAVDAAFAKGAPLLEVPQFKIHASRREAPGQAEVHMGETDIVYVLEGTATFVTGGKVVDGKTTAPGEIRGASIEGGETRSITRGDVVVVPAGTPHWFKDVKGPVLYYVVKVL
jgi:glc operon protein GlcG